jgi:hypothetical protein
MVYVTINNPPEYIMSNTVSELQTQLERLNKEITAQKALIKLQNCKLTAKTADKYFALQKAYLNACKGI